MELESAAVRTRLEAVPGLVVDGKSKVFDLFTTPVGTKIAPPYIVRFPSAGTDTSERFTGPNLTEHYSETLHLVGSSFGSVQVVFRNVKAAFVVGGFMVPPAITGRRCYNGYFRQPIPFQIDTDVTPPIAYAIVELGWDSDPA
jgi:hypothetical protein